MLPSEISVAQYFAIYPLHCASVLWVYRPCAVLGKMLTLIAGVNDQWALVEGTKVLEACPLQARVCGSF